MLFVGLLILIGGPFSRIYLWPMIADAEQRPTAGAFADEAETLPWTPASAAIATAAGAVSFWALAAAGVSFDTLFGIAVVLVFSPIPVNLFTTVGSIEAGRLTCDGTSVALAQVTGVRSVRVGNAVVCWVSYGRGTGVFVPRLVTVPSETGDVVLAKLRGGVETRPEPPNTDRAVRAVLGSSGLLFVGVAVLAVLAVDDPLAGAYLGGAFGAIGILLWVVGWRGV